MQYNYWFQSYANLFTPVSQTSMVSKGTDLYWPYQDALWKFTIDSNAWVNVSAIDPPIADPMIGFQYPVFV